MPWDGDLSLMGQLVERIADLASTPSRAAKEVSRELTILIDQEFDEGEDPYGTPWKSLAPATEDKGRFPPPLTDTRAMRDSLRVKPMRGAGVSITIAHPAAPHQTGWSGKQGTGPARPILPDREMPPEWEAIIEAAIDREIHK